MTQMARMDACPGACHTDCHNTEILKQVQSDSLVVQNDSLVVQNNEIFVQNDSLVVQDNEFVVQNDKEDPEMNIPKQS